MMYCVWEKGGGGGEKKRVQNNCENFAVNC